jgi:hypothetical protein
MDFEDAVNLSRFQQQFGGQGFKTRGSVPPGPCAMQAKTRLAQHYEMDLVCTGIHLCVYLHSLKHLIQQFWASAYINRITRRISILAVIVNMYIYGV